MSRKTQNDELNSIVQVVGIMAAMAVVIAALIVGGSVSVDWPFGLLVGTP